LGLACRFTILYHPDVKSIDIPLIDTRMRERIRRKSRNKQQLACQLPPRAAPPESRHFGEIFGGTRLLAGFAKPYPAKKAG